jgi:enoyl-CoA hydratase/carnithine racemase
MRSTILITVLVLGSTNPTNAADARDLSKMIDARIAAALKAAGKVPSAQADPSELLRRPYLDIIGRIPTVEEAAEYLKGTDPDKHHKLIDSLLVHPEMPVYWRGVFNHWLNGALDEKRPGEAEFLDYLEKRLGENVGWDRIARELLDPSESDPKGANASYFLASRLAGGDRAAQLDSMTVAVSSVFFGVQMQCAKCHDHPFCDDWKQENYYGLVAFLSRTSTTKGKGNLPALTEKGDGVVEFTGRKTGEQTARLLFLDGKVVDAKEGRRKALLAAGVNAESPYFKRAMVNRVWKQLMGVGLVTPVDQIHDKNPASHPELLADLAADFAKHNFDLRRLMAGILHSEAYLRSSRWTGTGTRPADSTYAVATLKPLTPPQLALALAQATGYADTLRAKYEREKANRKLDAVTLAVVRKQFEREREYATLLTRFKQEGEAFQASASHALYLTYNPTVRTILAPAGLVGRLTKLTDGAEVARTAYLTVLSRQPSDEEAAAITKHLATSGVAREELCRDVVWALLAGPEFRFNH